MKNQNAKVGNKNVTAKSSSKKICMAKGSRQRTGSTKSAKASSNDKFNKSSQKNSEAESSKARHSSDYNLLSDYKDVVGKCNSTKDKEKGARGLLKRLEKIERKIFCSISKGVEVRCVEAVEFLHDFQKNMQMKSEQIFVRVSGTGDVFAAADEKGFIFV